MRGVLLIIPRPAPSIVRLGQYQNFDLDLSLMILFNVIVVYSNYVCIKHDQEMPTINCMCTARIILLLHCTLFT